MQNPSTMTHDCRTSTIFRIFKIEDGGRIFTETLQKQMLQPIARDDDCVFMLFVFSFYFSFVP